LTLAIIDGLLVKVGGTHYVIPLSAVEECTEYNETDVKSGKGENRANVGDTVIAYRGSMLSCILLRQFFDSEEDCPEQQQVVVVRHRDQKLGLTVDQVIGGHQTVIKNLGRLYRDTPGISGATILGDGSVALILDIQRLAAELSRLEYGE
ncbi:MAG: chemotaxis protein CheA, partial [Spirochaetaceae bacterium]